MKKRIQTLDEWINEQELNEKKVLSPANIKEFDLNKQSVKELKNWGYKIKDLNFKYKDFYFYGREATFFEFMDNRNGLYDHFHISVNDDLNAIVKIEVGSKIDFDPEPFERNLLKFIVDKKTFLTKSDIDDPVLGFRNLLNFLFDKFSKDIYKLVDEKINLKTLYVIRAGKVSPSTGKTEHGWSIYDDPKHYLGVDRKKASMIWAADAMKVGDKFKILDDQTHKSIFGEFEITDLVQATYKDFVAFSKKTGAKIPIRPYKKQPGDFQYVLYSIK